MLCECIFLKNIFNKAGSIANFYNSFINYVCSQHSSEIFLARRDRCVLLTYLDLYLKLSKNLKFTPSHLDLSNYRDLLPVLLLINVRGLTYQQSKLPLASEHIYIYVIYI